MNKIAIIDYEMSNLNSIKNALDYLGYDSVVTSDPAVILNSYAAILPGVGAFPVAVKNLRKLGLIDTIHKFISQEKLFMGICLGMQLLFEESEEFVSEKGLGVLKGNVVGFDNFIKQKRIPHVGWNKLFFENKKDKFNDIYFYFVHSYFVQPDDKITILGTTHYESFNFCSLVKKNNILGCQFHPEKSGKDGLKFLNDFFKSIKI